MRYTGLFIIFLLSLHGLANRFCGLAKSFCKRVLSNVSLRAFVIRRIRATSLSEKRLDV